MRNSAYIYLCGPISGLPDGNRQAFENARKAILERYPNQGDRITSVINPHDTCATIVATHTGSEEELWRKCMRQDIKVMLDCDAVVMLDGWQNSRGATLERSIAQQLGIKVLTLQEALK